MNDKDMPRRAVVCRIAEDHGMTKTDAERVLRDALDEIAEQLVERGRFHIAEIGSLHLSERAPRKYFNPRTNVQDVSRGDIALKINISKKLRRRLGAE